MEGRIEHLDRVRGELGESNVMEGIQGRKDIQGGRSGQQHQVQQRFPIRLRQKSILWIWWHGGHERPWCDLC